MFCFKFFAFLFAPNKKKLHFLQKMKSVPRPDQRPSQFSNQFEFGVPHKPHIYILISAIFCPGNKHRSCVRFGVCPRASNILYSETWFHKIRFSNGAVTLCSKKIHGCPFWSDCIVDSCLVQSSTKRCTFRINHWCIETSFSLVYRKDVREREFVRLGWLLFFSFSSKDC